MICILCGHEKMAGCGMATVNGQYLCHPDNNDHQDCYKLYTVYGQRKLSRNQESPNHRRPNGFRHNPSSAAHDPRPRLILSGME